MSQMVKGQVIALIGIISLVIGLLPSVPIGLSITLIALSMILNVTATVILIKHTRDSGDK